MEKAMKAKDVLNKLRVTRQTLTKYVALGYIKVTKLPNGQYNYDDDSVYSFLNKDVTRKTVIYSRVSTNAQKSNLETQISTLKQFCFMQGITIHEIYKDIASGISFTKRDDFFRMLDEIIQGRIERVIITYKDRLSRVGFELFSTLFKKFGCKIVVMSEVGNPKIDSEEIFEEIVSLLHCYSIKIYSKRNKDKKVIEVGIE